MELFQYKTFVDGLNFVMETIHKPGFMFRAPMHFLKCLEMITSDTAWDHQVICILSPAKNVRERYFVTLIFSGFIPTLCHNFFVPIGHYVL